MNLPRRITILQKGNREFLSENRRKLKSSQKGLLDLANKRVVAVGAEVIGDLSGFAASAHMRGIYFYNIPS